MSFATNFHQNAKGEVVAGARTPHPRELQYGIEPDRLTAMAAAYHESHKDWTMDQCKKAVLLGLSEGLLGTITSAGDYKVSL